VQVAVPSIPPGEFQNPLDMLELDSPDVPFRRTHRVADRPARHGSREFCQFIRAQLEPARAADLRDRRHRQVPDPPKLFLKREIGKMRQRFGQPRIPRRRELRKQFVPDAITREF
jgi:hypothetical protein